MNTSEQERSDPRIGAAPDVLSAPLRVQFDYTRSVGPTIGKFLTALRARKIVGVRGTDGRVHVPPPEYDPITSLPLTEFVDVADTGTVESLLALMARWHDEGRTIIAVMHEFDQVRAHFPSALLLMRSPIAWGDTSVVLTADNLAQALSVA